MLDTWTLLYAGSHHIYDTCQALCTLDQIFSFLMAFFYLQNACWFLAKLEGFIFLLAGWYLCAVCWCCRLLTCPACGSLVICLMYFAVAWELSIFFVCWHTVLAGNLLNSTCPSFNVLETMTHPSGKNKIYLSVGSGLFLVGNWLMQLVPAQHCTTHCHSYLLAYSLWASQIWPAFHCLVAYKTLETSSILLLRSYYFHWTSSKICIGLNQNHHSRLTPSCIFLILLTSQAHILIYFYIWVTTWEIYYTTHL